MFDLFTNLKPVVAMVHLPSTPGSPRYDASRSFRDDLAGIQRDVDHLATGGVDGLLFCNEDDRPYSFDLGPATVAYMSRVMAETDTRGLPYGVDVLWDPIAALAIAATSGAAYIREVVSGTYESDMGLWAPDPARIWAYRRELGADQVQIWANIQPEFASALGSRDIAARARSTLNSCLPDALLVSGPMAGLAPDRRLLEETRAVMSDDVALVINTGAKADTVADFLGIADAVIVGSALKREGDTWAPVDGERVKRFMASVSAVR